MKPSGEQVKTFQYLNSDFEQFFLSKATTNQEFRGCYTKAYTTWKFKLINKQNFPKKNLAFIGETELPNDIVLKF